MNRDLEKELIEIEEKIEILKEVIKIENNTLREYERIQKNIQYEINRIKFKSEYRYTTLEAIMELTNDYNKVFRSSSVGIGGYTFLTRTMDGYMIHAEDSNGKKKNPLSLSHWNINNHWKEVFEVSEGVYE